MGGGGGIEPSEVFWASKFYNLTNLQYLLVTVARLVNFTNFFLLAHYSSPVFFLVIR